MPQALVVLLAAAITAAATGLGALPFAFRRFHGESALGISNAVAAGVMTGASASLLIQAGDRSILRAAIGALLGAAFVLALGGVLARTDTPDVAALTGSDARKAILVIAVMTAHSVAEGVGVGASFGGGDTLGLAITIAIAVHNVPEGVAVSLVLVPRGSSVRAAAGWSVLTSLPQPIFAVPAFLFVEAFGALLPVGLGFAAGAMLWMVRRELLPEALSQLPTRGRAVGWIALSGAAMFAVQTYVLA
jgi:zinc transporter ZupT